MVELKDEAAAAQCQYSKQVATPAFVFGVMEIVTSVWEIYNATITVGKNTANLTGY
jgi:hypothetical protein